MKSSEMIAMLEVPSLQVNEDGSTAVCGVVDDAEDDAEDTIGDGWDEEDFWEAIDLLQTAGKSMSMVVKYEKVGQVRKKLLTNLISDIQQFVDHFGVEE